MFTYKKRYDENDILLLAKHILINGKRFKPSSNDLTNEEIASEFITANTRQQIKYYRLKEARKDVTVEEPQIADEV